MKSIAIFFLCLISFVFVQAASVPSYLVKSPDGNLSFELRAGKEDLSFSILSGSVAVTGPSVLRMSLDGRSITQGGVVRDSRRYEVREKYPWLGVHAWAVNECNGLELRMTRGAV